MYLLGATGVREDLGHDFIDMIKRVKLVKDIPCAIGFGILILTGKDSIRSFRWSYSWKCNC